MQVTVLLTLSESAVCPRPGEGARCGPSCHRGGPACIVVVAERESLCGALSPVLSSPATTVLATTLSLLGDTPAASQCPEGWWSKGAPFELRRPGPCPLTRSTSGEVGWRYRRSQRPGVMVGPWQESGRTIPGTARRLVRLPEPCRRTSCHRVHVSGRSLRYASPPWSGSSSSSWRWSSKSCTSCEARSLMARSSPSTS